MFPLPLPDEQPGVFGEQLGGMFPDNVSDDGGYDSRDERFERLREDGMSFASLASDASSQDEWWPNGSFLSKTDVIECRVASVASLRAVGGMINGDYRMERFERVWRDWTSVWIDEVAAEVATITQLAAASKVSCWFANIIWLNLNFDWAAARAACKLPRRMACTVSDLPCCVVGGPSALVVA